jgi:hypothetical protein
MMTNAFTYNYSCSLFDKFGSVPMLFQVLLVLWDLMKTLGLKMMVFEIDEMN